MGKGGVLSFRDLTETIYADLFAYTTVKVVKTKDWRLSVMKRLFNAGVGIYVLFFLVFYHGYLFKESPLVTVSTIVSSDALALQLKNLSAYYSNGGYPPYCQSFFVNGTNSTQRATSTDYTWGPGRSYVNNECARYFTSPELTEKVYMGVWLYSYWQQSTYHRACKPNNYTTANGIPVAPGMVGNPSNVPNCNPAQLQLNQSVLPVAAEYIMVNVAGTYITTFGRTRTQMNTTVKSAASTGLNGSLYFAPTDQVTFTFQQLLALAGIDLDSPNELADGGNGPPWPSYRITGVEIVMEMQYRNYVETLFPLDPFNFNDYLIADVYPASKGTFRSPGSKVWYLGPDISQPETDFMVRTPAGVLLTFRPSGSIGTPTFAALLTTLVGAIVLFNFATTLVDVSAAFLIEGFREQKFEDELELRIRAMLRTQLADVPTRAEIDDYEKDVRLKRLKAEGQKARQKARLDRLRTRAQKGITTEARAAAAAVAGERAGPVEDNFGEAPVVAASPAEADPEVEMPQGVAATPLAGASRSLEPRVVRLVISGDNHHSSSFVAQGFLENCRCVRFQWWRSRDGRNWLPIPGATLPTFYASADDLAHIIAVDATPVTDDGFEGASRRAYTGALGTQAAMLSRVHEMRNAAYGGYIDLKDGVWVSGLRATVRLTRVSVVCRTKASVELGAVSVPGIEVSLSRLEPCAMTLTGADGMAFDLTWRTPEDRDVFALAVRELAGSSIELSNDLAYMPVLAVSDDED